VVKVPEASEFCTGGAGRPLGPYRADYQTVHQASPGPKSSRGRHVLSPRRARLRLMSNAHRRQRLRAVSTCRIGATYGGTCTLPSEGIYLNRAIGGAVWLMNPAFHYPHHAEQNAIHPQPRVSHFRYFGGTSPSKISSMPASRRYRRAPCSCIGVSLSDAAHHPLTSADASSLERLRSTEGQFSWRHG